MHPKRKQRLTLVAFLFAGVALAVGLALFALNENINLFYPPDQIARGEAPVDPVSYTHLTLPTNREV